MDGKHDRTTSGVTCHHCLWTGHRVERRRAWLDITALGLHARWNDVRRGMTSPPLDSSHGRQRWAWHAITTLGQHRRSDNLRHGRREWHYITALGQHTRSNYVGRGMTSPPLDSTHDRMKSGVACHHCLWASLMVRLRQAWHDLTALG